PQRHGGRGLRDPRDGRRLDLDVRHAREGGTRHARDARRARRAARGTGVGLPRPLGVPDPGRPTGRAGRHRTRPAHLPAGRGRRRPLRRRTARLGGAGRERRHVVTDGEPVLLVSLAGHAGRSYAEDMAALREAAGSVRETVALTGSFPGAVPFEEFLARADASPLEEPPGGAGSDDDPGLSIYTSGTTGRPKGALISHRALAEGCRLQATRVYHSPSVSLANLPVGHVAGLMDVVSVPLAMGGAVCFMEDFDPAAIPGVI